MSGTLRKRVAFSKLKRKIALMMPEKQFEKYNQQVVQCQIL